MKNNKLKINKTLLTLSLIFPPLLTQLIAEQIDEDKKHTTSASSIKWEQSFVDGIAAVVKINPNEKDKENPGTRVITAEEIRKELAPLLPQIRRDSPTEAIFHQKIEQTSRQILNHTIDQYLILEEARYIGVKVPESYLKNFFDGQIANEFGGDRTQYQEYLKATGKTDRMFKKEMEDELVIDYMRSLKRKSQAEISPRKIEDYYNAHKSEFVREASIHLKQIMVKNANESTLSTIFATLDSGVPFSTVAKQYSEDEKQNAGGDWGWINQSDIRSEIADVAFALEPKTYAKKAIIINNTAFIPYVEDKKTGGLATLSEVRKDIEKKLADELAIEAQEKWIRSLRAEASIQYLL